MITLSTETQMLVGSKQFELQAYGAFVVFFAKHSEYLAGLSLG